MADLFSGVKALENNSDLVKRLGELYRRNDDVRNEFSRDYTRILHSYAYRRLKHKTQVFFNGAENDHICTRMEHVEHVASVAHTIAQTLGLNTELTRAIAIAHDLGHAPFGHQGESVIGELTRKYLGKDFWHEQNGLYFVDKVELLAGPDGIWRNMSLTYAVRDGIISHCGELDNNSIRPRADLIDLSHFDKKGKYEACTWEGCVVKLADKIAYLGRDIEDAKSLGYFDKEKIQELENLAKINNKSAVNTTVIMHDLIIDLCNNSTPETGLNLSSQMSEHLNTIKKFNYDNIYSNPRLNPYKDYSALILNHIFDCLSNLYDKENTIDSVMKKNCIDRQFVYEFICYLAKYTDAQIFSGVHEFDDYEDKFANEKIYGDLSDQKKYIQAVVDFIAGMTDVYAVKSFDELLMC
ncbi:MAG: HD domain-containing protein [Paludibacteraceae bacterium]|nr:HD domain-containing protein [Paludibacteraceae bacterium]